MKKEFKDAVAELKQNSFYTPRLEDVLKDLFKLSEEGIKSLKVDELSDREIEGLNSLGYTVEFHENMEQIVGGDYFIVNGMF